VSLTTLTAQQRVVRNARHSLFAQASLDWTFQALEGVLVLQDHHIVKGATHHLARRHAQQGLGHRIQILNEAAGVRGHHSVANGVQRDLNELPLGSKMRQALFFGHILNGRQGPNGLTCCVALPHG
jgi:hypothetical protein